VKNRKYQLVLFLVLMVAGCLMTGIFSARASVPRQQPTVAVPTVTSSPEGPSIRVNADQTFIYVHTGPGQNYPVIGLIVAGQKAPALAMSPDQQWIQIIYLSTQGNIGWIYARVVSLSITTLPVVTPPPTPTQKVTPTLDPTLAARYPAGVPATLEPTYTEPAPLILPTYSPGAGAFSSTRFPIGFVIIGLAVIGLFGIMLSILRSR